MIMTHFEVYSSYADMNQYILRAEKAIEENTPSMAIGMYSQLLKDYDSGCDKEEQKKYAQTFLKASDICFSQNRFLESLEFATAALKASEKGNDNMMMMCVLGQIGNIHGIFEDFGRSINYYLRGYRIALDQNDASCQCKFLICLSGAYISSKDVAKAKECFRKLSLVTVSEDEIKERDFFNNYIQGTIAAAENKPLLARYHHKKALEIAEENELSSDLTVNQKWELGKTYVATHQPDSAIHYFNLALHEAKEKNLSGHTPKIYLSLSEIAKTSGDSATYLHYRHLEQEAIDEFFNLSKYNNTRNQLVEYEEMMKDSTILNLNNKVFMQRTLLIAGIVIIITIGIFYAILIRKNRELRFANKKLIEKNRELIKVEELNTKLLDRQLNIAENSSSSTDKPIDDSLSTNDDIIVNTDTATAQEEISTDLKPAYLSDEQIEILLTRIRKALKDQTVLFNPDFSLNMLAQIVKSNTKYVSWVINQTYDKNFKTLLNELRVQAATKMLDDYETYGKYTIQAISEETGYKSSTSFIVAFKKIIGMTPSVYQKLAKERLHRENTFD